MPSIWHILILLLVVVLIFGTSKLRNLGSDLGGAIKSFRKGMQDEENASSQQDERLKADPPPTAAEQPQHETHSTK